MKSRNLLTEDGGRARFDILPFADLVRFVSTTSRWSAPRLRGLAVAASPVLILVTPAAFLKGELDGLKPELLLNKTICSGIKGFVPGDNCVVGESIHNHYDIPYSYSYCYGAKPC